MQRAYTQKETINFLNFFKQMAVACSIFTLGGWVQLFLTAFGPIFTVVPLKVALGWHKFDFWAFQKNNHDVTLDNHLHDYHIRSDLMK